MSTSTRDADRFLAEAITAFVLRAAAEDVRVDCHAGVASLRGAVRSHSARTALEDLVRAHDGVCAVDNYLVLEPAAAAGSRRTS